MDAMLNREPNRAGPIPTARAAEFHKAIYTDEDQALTEVMLFCMAEDGGTGSLTQLC